MFSIVIPTMWKFAPFIDFLVDLVEIDLVGEIIIINNNLEATPIAEILSNSKIKLHNFSSNIYVNPAWNYGVENSKYDKICIMNDDLIYDTRIFSRVSSILTEKVGLIGIISDVDQNHVLRPQTGQISFEKIPFCEAPGLWYVPWHQMPMYGFKFPYGIGQLMFVHKNNWINIPNELQIYCGDCFIYDTQHLNGREVYGIENLWHYTPFSVTSNGVDPSFVARESPFYDKLIGNLKKDFFLNKIVNQW